jgi:hypothetical protein
LQCRDAFNRLDKRGGIGGEFVGVGESGGGGIDVNHGHKSLLLKSVKQPLGHFVPGSASRRFLGVLCWLSGI